MEFKVGDTVRIKDDCSGCKKGDMCTLSQGSKNGELVEFLFAYNEFTKGGGCSCQSNRELIEKPVYKVGDRVKVLKAYCTPEIIGETHTIVKIDGCKHYLDNVEGYWSNTNDFELIEEEVKSQLYTTPLYVDKSADYDSRGIWSKIAHISLKETLDEEYKSTIPNAKIHPFYNALLNSKLKTPMNTLRQNLRDRFFKKEESKIADLVESVEERLVPIQELDHHLIVIFTNIGSKIRDMEYAVENKNKEDVKLFKSQLENYNKELNDELMKQLLTIAKKLFKEDK